MGAKESNQSPEGRQGSGHRGPAASPVRRKQWKAKPPKRCEELNITPQP